MAIRSASDLVYTTIAKLPFLLLLVGVAYVLFHGVLALETFSFGTEYLIGNDESANRLPELPGASRADVLAAIESGDTEQMLQALEQVDPSQAAELRQAQGVVAAG